jgi:hypothetical protein
MFTNAGMIYMATMANFASPADNIIPHHAQC